MDDKLIKRFIFYAISLMIVLPFVINSLMFININILPVSGDIKTWIATLGGIWGAIVGGIISGVLTLVGVNKSIEASFDGIEKTIEYQDKEKFKESIGLKLERLYRVKKIIYKLDLLLSFRKQGWNEKRERDEPDNIDNAILRYVAPELNNLLELSASVDWEFYNELKKFVDGTRENFINRFDLDDLTTNVESLVNDIELKHENRLSEKFKEVSMT